MILLRLLTITLFGLIVLSGCNNYQEIKKLNARGISTLSNYELLDYRRRLISEITKRDRSVKYNELDARVNASMMNTYSRYGFSNAANQAGVDLVGNIVVGMLEQNTIDDLYTQFYSVTAALKRRGWDGAYGFNQVESPKILTEKDRALLRKQSSSSPGLQTPVETPVTTRTTKVVIGESSNSVEQMATAAGCKLDGAAELLSSKYSEEVYKVSCENSDSLVFKCLYRNCDQLH